MVDNRVVVTCTRCGSRFAEGVRFCAHCGTEVGIPEQPVEERKLATVLFADLVGSTAAADAQDPERTRARLERFYDAIAAEIEAAGGTVEKYAGDDVMAAFGAPMALEDHAERALHAALAMQRGLRAVFGDELAIRIGVNTGEVVAGRAREGSSFVSGDVVNVAARIEKAAEAGEILIGERTAALVRGAFELGESRTVVAKGKQGGVVARRVLRPVSPTAPRGVGGLGHAFVGRHGELDRLRRAYAETVERAEPRLVTIVGNAGVGKSRLVEVFVNELAHGSPHVLRRRGRCLAYGRGVTYSPLADVLREHFGLLESDAETEVRQRLAGREILGLTLGRLETASELHPLVVRERLEEAWVKFVDEMASRRPLVLLIEDLHWSREPLRNLLERLHRDARAPVLLLATARPEFIAETAGWGTRPGSSLLWVEPLGGDDTGLLVEALLGAEPPAEICRLVLERAEGNPFFVEELLGTLIDRGAIRRENGAWQALDLPSDFDVPDSIRGVVAARVDLLRPAEKETLQAAAVIGRVFSPSAIYAIAPRIEPDLHQLEVRDFIRRRAESSLRSEREYEFKHALTREVAHASVPKKRRARLHASFAEWIEQDRGEGDENASLLAHHYAEAVRPEDADLAWSSDAERYEQLRQRAEEWLRRAATLAIGRYAVDDALAFLHAAVELEDDVHAQVDLWKQIAETHELRYDWPAFREALEKALSLSKDDPNEQAEIYSLLSLHTAAKAAMWTYSPATRELVEGWIERAIELSPTSSPARVRALVARAMRNPDAIDEAIAAAAQLGDPELTSFAWGNRVGESIKLMRYGDAINSTERRLPLIDAIDDPDHRADLYAYAAYAALGRGNVEEARRLSQIHETIAAGVSAHHDIHCLDVRCRIEACAGNWQHIREREREVVAAVKANLETPCTGNVSLLFECAAAQAVHGDDERAAELEAEAETLSNAHPLYADLRLLVALRRDELETIEQLLTGVPSDDGGWSFIGWPARLEALTLLADRARVEKEAPPMASSETIFAPFALRALGVVRGDNRLTREAADRFRAIGLHWHADQSWMSGIAASADVQPRPRGK